MSMAISLAPPWSGPLRARDPRRRPRRACRKRARDDAAGERGGVELVLGVQDQRDVDDPRPPRPRACWPVIMYSRLAAWESDGSPPQFAPDDGRPSITFCMCPMIVGILASRRLDLRRFAAGELSWQSASVWPRMVTAVRAHPSARPCPLASQPALDLEER